MFLIVRLFFIVIGLFFLVTFITGLSVALRIRHHLKNPFLKPDESRPPPPPPGKGEIIEGDFRVLNEKRK